MLSQFSSNLGQLDIFYYTEAEREKIHELFYKTKIPPFRVSTKGSSSYKKFRAKALLDLFQKKFPDLTWLAISNEVIEVSGSTLAQRAEIE